MKPGICFKEIWSDDDVVVLKIDSFDGNSLFSTKVYVGHQSLVDLTAELSDFKDKVYGGIYDIQMGAFGPEYANGAFRARLHFSQHSKIHITVEAESEFEDFGRKNVASRATLYLISEPVLLDNFIAELLTLSAGSRDEAKLESLYPA
jgi:hypothetical protein